MSLVFCKKLNCFKLHNVILIDNQSIPNIINLKAMFDFNNFDFRNNTWYVKNVKLYNILFADKEFNYIEQLKDHWDFRISNVEFKNYKIEEPSNVNILEYGDFLKLSEGKYSGQIRNMYWKVSSENEIYYLMSCRDLNKNTIYFKFDVNSLEKVLNVYKDKRYTWHIGKNGYVKTSYVNNNGKKINRYLHQHLMDYYGHGLTKNSKTIDHINRDKLDNRLSNLRLATQSQQNQNTDKRKRKKNAKALPEGITQQMLPKYVVYYRECYNKEKQLYREFFKIEKHPKLDKPKSGSKSNKKSIKDKLEEIKQLLTKIDNNQSIEADNKLPVGIRLKKKEDKTELILDYRIGDNRYNLKMKCKDSKTFEVNYNIFKTKILKKYPTYII